MNRRGPAIFATGLAALSLAACGDDERPAREEPGRPEARKPAPPPATTARSLRQETEALLGDLTATGRRVAEERRVSQATVERLEAQERRARELAARARDELPEEDLNREALAALNDALAGVASRLQELATSPDPAAREGARREIEAAEDAARRLRDDADGRTRRQLERQLEDLSRRVPEIRAR